MAQIPASAGQTVAVLTAAARPSTIPPALTEVPGGLYPLISAAYEVDEYRILNGWPIPVPDLDIRIDCLVSAEGDVIGNRDDPTAVVTNADMRWIADTNYYDQISLRWVPIQSNVSPWEATPDHAPTLITDYEYRIGGERFVNMTALNFDSNTADYLTNDLGLVMGGTSGYTLIMVMSPNSIYGNDQALEENGLWGPPDTTGHWVAFTVKDQAVYMTTETMTTPVPEVYTSRRGVPIGNALDSNAPSYLAMVVARPTTTLYAASGPSRILVKSVVAGPATDEPPALSTRFWLGNAPLATAATMDMALLDLGIYGNPLTSSQVAAEFATLSSIYGGDT